MKGLAALLLLAVLSVPVMALERLPVDSDNDSVVDDIDSCLGTAPEIQVDGLGCPRDDDRDGVANYMDQCPLTGNLRIRIDERGCYARVSEAITIEMNVEFATASDVLTEGFVAEGGKT